MAQTWTRQAQGVYSAARAWNETTRTLVEESRRQLNQSDELIQWYEAYGPKPTLRQVDAIEGVAGIDLPKSLPKDGGFLEVSSCYMLGLAIGTNISSPEVPCGDS
jgi:hypothetical protein